MIQHMPRVQECVYLINFWIEIGSHIPDSEIALCNPEIPDFHEIYIY